MALLSEEAYKKEYKKSEDHFGKLLLQNQSFLSSLQSEIKGKDIKPEIDRMIAALSLIKPNNDSVIRELSRINNTLLELQKKAESKTTVFTVKRDFQGFIQEVIAKEE